MFVAKITTAITKASGKMFDIMEKDGTLRGGSLEMKMEMSVSRQKVFSNHCYIAGVFLWLQPRSQGLSSYRLG